MAAVEPQYFSIPPPTPQSFKTRQDVKDYRTLHSKAHGYAITTEASRSNKYILYAIVEVSTPCGSSKSDFVLLILQCENNQTLGRLI